MTLVARPSALPRGRAPPPAAPPAPRYRFRFLPSLRSPSWPRLGERTMSDPAVSCYLTKTLCAQGGRLPLPELQRRIGLSAPQLRDTLAAAGTERFLLLLDGDARVLALAPLRVCVRKECGGCERLHLCKSHVLGRCRLGARSCNYSHDIISPENRKVLKAHGLSSLDENELRVLLLQNDPFFLPAVCHFYNGKNDTCHQQNNCNKLHICQHFLQGQCRFLPCRKSHNLLDAHALRVLEAGGIDVNTASNIQAICYHKYMELNKELKKGISKKDDSSAKDLKEDKKDNSDEICLFYVWKYCKHRDKCGLVHYHLPYRWQVYNGVSWNDLHMMEEIEKDYCNPKNSCTADNIIDFRTMTDGPFSVRRLSTPSSVTKPTFVLTTQWIWYWKNDQGQWIEYGQQGEEDSVNSPSSAVIENLYLADPDATISFQAGLYSYDLNFKEMAQTNTSSRTRRRVCRRPKFVSSEDVQRIKKGQMDSSIPNQACPTHWDQSALPDFGYKAVELSNTASEYNQIKQMFHQTMKSYSILNIKRIQNPSLWKVFRWQKDHMKRENGGKEVNERLLFYGTNSSFVETICNHNLDWRICGTNGNNYGQVLLSYPT
ncbi:zinc finger CCCH-type antiviral protein 1 isoform X2 [Cuculus canorus]|uniref:zinc finger CCCH-type antiviral protein 1 isoform X2 n=1 Tax=Cuculus canorus TaxID=55661 RepID=UPI0023AB2F0D|nr:zinc finger CCCH-type antiviral protein 1 isoform X2 [Cuculus canorus]